MALDMPPQVTNQADAQADAKAAAIEAHRKARIERELGRENMLRAQGGQPPLTIEPPAPPAQEAAPAEPTQQEAAVPVAEPPAAAEAVAPAPSEQVPTPDLAQASEEVKTVNLEDEEVTKWRKEAETFREKSKKLEGVARQLAPLQQKAAVAEQQLHTKDSEIASLKSEIAEIKQLLQQGTLPKTQAPTPEAMFEVPVYDPSADAEFAELYPEAAERLKAISVAQARSIQQLSKTYEQKLNEISSQLTGDRQSQHQAYVSDYMQRWDKQIQQFVPNIADYVSDSPKAQAFRSWLHAGFSGYASVVQDPYNHAPQDIAFIIKEFERQATPSRQTKEPSVAEIANPALTGRAAPVIEEAPAEDYLTNEQMANIDRELRKLRHAGKFPEAEALKEKYARTYIKQRNGR